MPNKNHFKDLEYTFREKGALEALKLDFNKTILDLEGLITNVIGVTILMPLIPYTILRMAYRSCKQYKEVAKLRNN